MSDINVTVSALDEALELLEKYIDTLEDVRAEVVFMLNQSFNLYIRDREGSDDGCPAYAFYEMEELLGEWNRQCTYFIDLAGEARRETGLYARNAIKFINNSSELITKNGYALCIVDSRKYPQAAENIRISFKRGYHGICILDRENAGARRVQRLKNIPVKPGFDRDEAPAAMFKPLTGDTQVFYVVGPDNRGCGAYMKHQLSILPNGTKVKVIIV